ncbi:MAG TPA: quinolinate synthase NadA [Candidatus Baltobacteraceae bacterium]|nr:quinolinate synthase NadA [Candidatus Baltobacteraceae bacterium]
MSVTELTYSPDVERETRPIFERVSSVIPAVEWPVHAPYVAAINRLKRERNAVILAHNYQVPEIFHTVADIVGDSLGLAMEAARTDADVIVLCGVHFMAETAKLVNPGKTVLVPDLRAGCSLAESITGADVRLLRERYPGIPVVTYVNTSAEVKAESDVCVTSGNAVKIVNALGAKRVIFLPDEYLAKYVASQTDVEIIAWKGHCEVHERFTGAQLRAYREDDPDLIILAHPECPPDVLAEADYVGSTQGMIDFVGELDPSIPQGASIPQHDKGASIPQHDKGASIPQHDMGASIPQHDKGASIPQHDKGASMPQHDKSQHDKRPRVVMITECSMASNVSANFPKIDFIRPCNLCPHMKRNTLPKVLYSLQTMQYEVTVDPAIATRARAAVERMLEYSA